MKYVSYLGLIITVLNTVYTNLIDTGVDKRIVLAVYIAGLVLAGVGKGLEKASKLNNRWVTIIAVLAGAAAALVEIDPVMKAWLPANLNTALIVIAGIGATLSKSLLDPKVDGVIYADKDKPPIPPIDKILSILILCAFTSSFSGCYVQAGDISPARKMILALNDSAHYTRLALNTNILLARTNVIAPERALVFNESLRKFNAAQQRFESFLNAPGVMTFDSNGKAILVLTLAQRGEAQGLLDAIAAAATDVLGDELLGGSAQRSQQYKPLITSLRDLSKRIAAALASMRQVASSPDPITVPLLLDRAQWESLKGA